MAEELLAAAADMYCIYGSRMLAALGSELDCMAACAGFLFAPQVLLAELASL